MATLQVSDRVHNEALTGAINGVNTVFSTSSTFVPGSESVLFNGIVQTEGAAGDYLRSEAPLGGG